METFYLSLAGLLGIGATSLGVSLWFHFHELRKEAAQAAVLREQTNQQQSILDEVDHVNKIRDKLRTDADYAERVRRRYTRNS